MTSSILMWLLALTKCAIVAWLLLAVVLNVWLYIDRRDVDSLPLLWTEDNQLVSKGMKPKQLVIWRLTQFTRWVAAGCAFLFLAIKSINLFL